MLKEKIVTIGEKKYKFVQPTLQQSSVADMEFSKAYTNALVNGLLPRQALERKLLATGAWTQTDEDMIGVLQQRAQAALEKMALAETKEEKDNGLAEYYELRGMIMSKANEKQALFTHTAESKGDEARVIELIWLCVYNEDGTRVWPSKDVFLSTNSTESSGLIAEFVGYISGLDERISTFDDLIKSSYEMGSEQEKTEQKQEEDQPKEDAPVKKVKEKKKDD